MHPLKASFRAPSDMCNWPLLADFVAEVVGAEWAIGILKTMVKPYLAACSVGSLGLEGGIVACYATPTAA
jgi:hypothetical protein